MVTLKPQLLERGLAAATFHGYGTFLPEPPEFTLVRKNWKNTKAFLTSIDLDTYEGYSPIRSFAPKSRLNVRRVSLLHPYDFIFYTSLALAMKEGIAKSRLSADRVFSYRTEKTSIKQLYAASPSFKEFKAAAAKRVTANPEGFIGVTDIADFFPRIYQHRLINALEATTAGTQRDKIRALEKMLFRFSEGTSYGIPIGPPASRLLAEAVLIDVDSTLISYGVDFIRFVDDYVIFSERPQDAEYAIRVLGETLFLNHGLTLQTAKTKVMSAADYSEKYLTLHSEKEENRRKLFEMLGDSIYEETSYDDLDDDQKKEIDAYNLVEMLTEALGEGENVDYHEVSFILGRLSSLQKPELISLVLESR
jgi:reverse transcriptase-like protein